MPGPARIDSGEVSLLYVRVRQVEDDVATVLVATPGSHGGPGVQQLKVPLTALAGRRDSPPDFADPAVVPPLSWVPD